VSSTKASWLEAGLEILASHGPGSLTIDNLVIRMQKTKGSYYHHFKHSKNYQHQLLSYWLDTTPPASWKKAGQRRLQRKA